MMRQTRVMSRVGIIARSCRKTLLIINDITNEIASGSKIKIILQRIARKRKNPYPFIYFDNLTAYPMRERSLSTYAIPPATALCDPASH